MKIQPDENELLCAGQLSRDPRTDSVRVDPLTNAKADASSSMAVRDPWPAPLGSEALCGIVGDFVALVEPHTEADPVALVFQFLTLFGNVIGRCPHFAVERDLHRGNLFVCLVGRTAKGRKGTAYGQARHPFAEIDSQWYSERHQGGLSSGEGLIWAVRDPITKDMPVREGAKGRGKIIAYEPEIVDKGIADKRLLVFEPEFGSVLHVIGRERNTLSAIIRQAWDSGDLRTLTKNSPAVATGAYISLIGHITRDELRRFVCDTDLANGLANRFLWVCVRRSKCLPFGGDLNPLDMIPLIERLRLAVTFARRTGEVSMDDSARGLWSETYPTLSEGRPGLLGAATNRAEAQVLRLSMLYGLLGRSAIICRKHVEAALALWRYAEASARFAFGSALGDPTADRIREALQQHPEGLTRTALRDLFDRNESAVEIERALAVLLEHGLALRREKGTGGRPSEQWFLTNGVTTETTETTEGPGDVPR